MPTADVDGLRVDYTDAGVGLPLVFVSGVYGSAEWFRYQVSGLSDRYRVIGCGIRAARGHVDYSLDLLAGDLMRFMDTLKIHGAVLIGHTLAAQVALKVAAASPERGVAVVAVSAVPSLAGVAQEDIIERLSPGEVEQETFFARMWNRIRGAKAELDDDPDPLSYLARHGGNVDKATLSARLQLVRDSDISAILPEVAAPTLVVAGSNDWSRILSGSQMIDQMAPNSTLEVLEDADHFCFFTRHDLFNAALDDFVSREVPRL